MEDLQNLWKKLSLIEAKEVIVEKDEGGLEENIPQKYFVIGRLHSIRPFNVSVMISTLKAIWKLVKQLDVDIVNDN